MHVAAARAYVACANHCAVCRARSPFDMDAYRPSCSNTCPSEFAMIVHDCIKSNPEKRPNASEVCSRLNHALSKLCPLHSTRNPSVATGSNGNGTLPPPPNGINSDHRNSSIVGSMLGSRYGSAPGGDQTVKQRHANTVSTRPQKNSNMLMRCFGV